VALATGARFALESLGPDVIPFATYFPAVLFAALVGGTGAGIVALVLSALAGWYFFVTPAFAFLPIGPTRAANFLLFVAAMALIVWGVALYRRTRQRLDESARRLSAVSDTAVDAIITIDANGIIQGANPATEKLFGHRPTDLVGQNVAELMPQPYSGNHGSYIRNYLDTGVCAR
jgi:PAS domain-containing protein